MPNPGDEHEAGDIPEETPPDARPLSQRMLFDGMYPGIVEKWAKAIAGLEAHAEALERDNEESYRMKADRNRGYAMFYRQKCLKLKEYIRDLEARNEDNC